jgi:hypothetical protein
MHEVPAGDSARSAPASSLLLAGAVTGDTVADASDAAELLDVDV